jgi:hypothetical protein
MESIFQTIIERVKQSASARTWCLVHLSFWIHFKAVQKYYEIIIQCWVQYCFLWEGYTAVKPILDDGLTKSNDDMGLQLCMRPIESVLYSVMYNAAKCLTFWQNFIISGTIRIWYENCLKMKTRLDGVQ